MTEEVRVRFAPSPTGFLHIGGARTALYNWLWARHTGGKFILRIEDTDRERSTPELTGSIVEALRWLGLDWDEGPEVGGDYGPYLQSERTQLYRERIDELLANGAAYRCFCSKEALDAKRAAAREEKRTYRYDRTCRDLTAAEVQAKGAVPYVVRLKVPNEGTVTFTDRVRGRIETRNDHLDDFVIARTDGSPMFLLTNVIDDAAMRISLVMRGEDHISNTPKQLHLYRALGVAPPEYAHIPLILGPDRKRLSKRHGATSVQAYRDLGFIPEALINGLALMGWSDSESTQLFAREELVSQFTVDRVNKSAAVFSYDKLLDLNHKHLHALPDNRRMDLICAWLAAQLGDAAPQRHELTTALELVGDRYRLLAEVWDKVGFFFVAPDGYTAKAQKILRNEVTPQVLLSSLEVLGKVGDWNVHGIETALRQLVVDSGLSMNKVFQPIRVALCGDTASPGLFETLALLGQGESLARIRACMETLIT